MSEEDFPEFDAPAWLRQTAMKALREYESCKRRGEKWPKQETCSHFRLDEDGICRRCGADKRGIG